MSPSAYDYRVEFSGSLFGLLQTLEPFLPPKAALIAAQKWILQQCETPDALLPVRVFGRRPRGVAFGRFIAVDNEPVAELYARLSDGWEPTSNFETLFSADVLPVSWNAPDALTRYHARPARTRFRERGILLAHVFDASKNIGGDDEATCLTRYARTMNPVNVVPWPAHKRTIQVITDAGPVREQLRGGGRNPHKDLSCEPVIQQILGGWMAEHVGGLDDPNATTWLVSARGDASETMRNWRRLAEIMRVHISPKIASGTAESGPSVDARASGALPLEEFIEELALLAAARRHDSSAASTLGSSRTLNATFFTDDLAEFNVKYTLAGDSKLAAVERLVDAVRNTREEDEAWTLFSPVKDGDKRRLRFAGETDAKGLYLSSV